MPRNSKSPTYLINKTNSRLFPLYLRLDMLHLQIADQRIPENKNFLFRILSYLPPNTEIRELITQAITSYDPKEKNTGHHRIQFIRGFVHSQYNADLFNALGQQAIQHLTIKNVATVYSQLQNLENTIGSAREAFINLLSQVLASQENAVTEAMLDLVLNRLILTVYDPISPPELTHDALYFLQILTLPHLQDQYFSSSEKSLQRLREHSQELGVALQLDIILGDEFVLGHPWLNFWYSFANATCPNEQHNILLREVGINVMGSLLHNPIQHERVSRTTALSAARETTLATSEGHDSIAFARCADLACQLTSSRGSQQQSPVYRILLGTVVQLMNSQSDEQDTHAYNRQRLDEHSIKIVYQILKHCKSQTNSQEVKTVIDKFRSLVLAYYENSFFTTLSAAIAHASAWNLDPHLLLSAKTHLEIIAWLENGDKGLQSMGEEIRTLLGDSLAMIEPVSLESASPNIDLITQELQTNHSSHTGNNREQFAHFIPSLQVFLRLPQAAQITKQLWVQQALQRLFQIFLQARKEIVSNIEACQFSRHTLITGFHLQLWHSLLITAQGSKIPDIRKTATEHRTQLEYWMCQQLPGALSAAAERSTRTFGEEVNRQQRQRHGEHTIREVSRGSAPQPVSAAVSAVIDQRSRMLACSLISNGELLRPLFALYSNVLTSTAPIRQAAYHKGLFFILLAIDVDSVDHRGLYTLTPELQTAAQKQLTDPSAFINQQFKFLAQSIKQCRETSQLEGLCRDISQFIRQIAVLTERYKLLNPTCVNKVETIISVLTPALFNRLAHLMRNSPGHTLDHQIKLLEHEGTMNFKNADAIGGTAPSRHFSNWFGVFSTQETAALANPPLSLPSTKDIGSLQSILSLALLGNSHFTNCLNSQISAALQTAMDAILAHIISGQDKVTEPQLQRVFSLFQTLCYEPSSKNVPSIIQLFQKLRAEPQLHSTLPDFTAALSPEKFLANWLDHIQQQGEQQQQSQYIAKNALLVAGILAQLKSSPGKSITQATWKSYENLFNDLYSTSTLANEYRCFPPLLQAIRALLPSNCYPQNQVIKNIQKAVSEIKCLDSEAQGRPHIPSFATQLQSECCFLLSNNEAMKNFWAMSFSEKAPVKQMKQTVMQLRKLPKAFEKCQTLERGRQGILDSATRENRQNGFSTFQQLGKATHLQLYTTLAQSNFLQRVPSMLSENNAKKSVISILEASRETLKCCAQQQLALPTQDQRLGLENLDTLLNQRKNYREHYKPLITEIKKAIATLPAPSTQGGLWQVQPRPAATAADANSSKAPRS